MTVERVYTPEEADALLPDLRVRLARIREARQVMLGAAEIVRERLTTDGGGSDPGPAYRHATTVLRQELEYLAAESIVLRDPEKGLVDFLGERAGERVWLCWLLGESRVSHWHPLESGFASRRPL